MLKSGCMFQVGEPEVKRLQVTLQGKLLNIHVDREEERINHVELAFSLRSLVESCVLL